MAGGEEVRLVDHDANRGGKSLILAADFR